MSNLKVPIIIGVIGFILIFIINLIVGNTFFHVITRSLLYGLTVSGITYGIIFVFKNYLGIDLEFNQVNGKENDSNVDIVVGNEDNEESGEIDNDTESENQFQYSADMNNLESVDENVNEKDFSEESSYDSSDIDMNSDYKESVSDEESEAGDETVFDTGNYGIDENEETENMNTAEGEESENLDRLSGLSYDSERIEDEAYSAGDENSEVSSETLKQRIGVDVSFEDVAKAIRTKLKSDK